eukprot:scaffold14.g1266.t1
MEEVDLLQSLGLEGSASGEVLLRYPAPDGPPALQPGLPLPPWSPHEGLRRLAEAVLGVRLAGPAADVAVAGHSWLPRFVDPPQWGQPSEPRTAVEPLLSQGYPCDGDSEGGSSEEEERGEEEGGEGGSSEEEEQGQGEDGRADGAPGEQGQQGDGAAAAGQQNGALGERSDGGRGAGRRRRAAPRVGFREVDIVAAAAAAAAAGEEGAGAAAAALTRRPQARQGTREFVRGRLGSAPFAPGGEAWEAGGNPAAAAAAAEAATGAWLAELEAAVGEEESAGREEGSAEGGARQGEGRQQARPRHPPRALAPGLTRGVFGAWAAAEGEEEEEGGRASAAVVGLAEGLTELALREESAAAAAAAAEQQQRRQQEGGQGGRVALQDLFSGVWLVEGEEEEEEGEEEAAAEGAVADAAAVGREAVGALGLAAVLDQLALLPEGTDLPGGVEGGAADAGELAAALAPAGAGVGASAPAPAPAPKRQRPDADWAVKGTIPNLKREFDKLRPHLAKAYPFELDVFQKEAVVHMEAGRSVFVAAHTSAGKTVVAEYAFALARWAPTHRSSSRGALVHYVNDAERGVVWEEVIIMLPAHVNLVLLSATVPNVMEFAGWVGRTKRKPIYVTGTTRRPVPLEHSLYYGGQLYAIARGDTYLAQGFRAAREAQAGRQGRPATRAEAQRALPTGRGDGGRGGRGGGSGGGRGGGRGGGGGAQRALAAATGGGGGGHLRSERGQWMQLVEMLRKKELLPCVVFVFSKKRCDALTDNLANLDLTTAAGGGWVLRVREMLKRGLGVHHAGLLPIVKEIVEMLFCRGVIKVLFSTGAARLDPSGRVVAVCAHVEDMLRRSFAEFHAQRAQPEQAAALARGELALRRLRARPWPASPLATSRAAVEEYDALCAAIEALDAQLQAQARGARGPLGFRVMASRGAQQALGGGRVVLVRDAATGVTELGVVCEAEASGGGSGGRRPQQRGLGAAPPPPPPDDASAAGRRRVVLSLHRPSPLDPAGAAAEEAAAVGPSGGAGGAGLGLLNSGGGGGAAPPKPMRVLRKKDSDDDLLMGMMGRAGGKKGGGGVARGAGGAPARALALPAAGEVGGQAYRIRQEGRGGGGLDADAILGASAAAATAAAVHALARVRDDAGGRDPPALDPVADLKLSSLGVWVWVGWELVAGMRERGRLAAARAAHAAHADPLLPEMLAMMPEFHQRVGVLQRLGYLGADKAVTMKGRVACEVNSGDELVATELIFGGVLTELEPEEAVALLSALVFQAGWREEKTAGEPELPPRLQQAREETAALAHQAGVVQAECGLAITPDEFVQSTLKFGLMEVVYEWARGTPFQQICGLTDVMEGSIVRCVVRLDETCREFRDAARVMGNTALFAQMDRASQLIKRDVVFAASLYLQ